MQLQLSNYCPHFLLFPQCGVYSHSQTWTLISLLPPRVLLLCKSFSCLLSFLFATVPLFWTLMFSFPRLSPTAPDGRLHCVCMWPESYTSEHHYKPSVDYVWAQSIHCRHGVKLAENITPNYHHGFRGRLSQFVLQDKCKTLHSPVLYEQVILWSLDHVIKIVVGH